jgi:hypothetical protein
MGASTADSEAAVDPGEAIRQEIRATLRAAGAEKANAPTSRLLAINVLDTAALRLLSGCA